ncbi:hypothetical protein AC249_AIPGENE12373 [Exaiptasia diaphana]|nr:hypothetical protein AC249_AIPGENE12373 [Exaiptasia diaphana]
MSRELRSNTRRDYAALERGEDEEHDGVDEVFHESFSELPTTEDPVTDDVVDLRRQIEAERERNAQLVRNQEVKKLQHQLAALKRQNELLQRSETSHHTVPNSYQTNVLEKGGVPGLDKLRSNRKIAKSVDHTLANLGLDSDSSSSNEDSGPDTRRAGKAERSRKVYT